MTSASVTAAVPHASMSSCVAPRHILSIGQVLNETFEVRGLLGEGGMGQVYEAHDRTLNRRVAIKVMWAHVSTSIRGEACALAAIHHPCMATVYAVGKHADVEYVVMERINGVSLAALIDARRGAPIEIDEALRILAGIADGLAAVHRAGIAHRDVKPANVMIAPDDRVVLMDFGIFQAVSDANDQSDLMGSPPYMAPELVTNDVQRGELFLIDVYAFGILAFELLTGNTPFRGKVMSVLSAHLNEPVPDIERLRRDAPPRLCALVRELVAKNPEDRPQSMEGVAWRVRDVRRRATEAPLRRLSVLIADDDEANVTVMKALVEMTAPEADVLVARNGLETIELLRRNKPHLLLLDLQMPRMNGVEVCMYVSGMPATTEACTIIAVSVAAGAHDVDVLRSLGVSKFIPKGDALRERMPAVIEDAKRRMSERAESCAVSR